MYAKVENGNITAVGLPQTGVLSDGREVSNYDMLDNDTLMAEGWLPIEINQPEYDPATQELQFSGYDIQTDKIVSSYITVTKVIPEPQPETPEQEISRLKVELEMTDYKIIKCAEYQLAGVTPLPYDIDALHAERQAMRDRITQLGG